MALETLYLLQHPSGGAHTRRAEWAEKRVVSTDDASFDTLLQELDALSGALTPTAGSATTAQIAVDTLTADDVLNGAWLQTQSEGVNADGQYPLALISDCDKDVGGGGTHDLITFGQNQLAMTAMAAVAVSDVIKVGLWAGKAGRQGLVRATLTALGATLTTTCNLTLGTIREVVGRPAAGSPGGGITPMGTASIGHAVAAAEWQLQPGELFVWRVDTIANFATGFMLNFKTW